MQKCPRVVAPRGERSVCQVTSAERGSCDAMRDRVCCRMCSFSGFVSEKNSYGDAGDGNANRVTRSVTPVRRDEQRKLFMESSVSRSTLHRQCRTHVCMILIVDGHESQCQLWTKQISAACTIYILTMSPRTCQGIQPLDRTKALKSRLYG